MRGLRLTLDCYHEMTFSRVKPAICISVRHRVPLGAIEDAGLKIKGLPVQTQPVEPLGQTVVELVLSNSVLLSELKLCVFT